MTRCWFCSYDADLDALATGRLMTTNGCEVCRKCGSCVTHGENCKDVGREGFKWTSEKIDSFMKEFMESLPEDEKMKLMEKMK